MNTKLQDLLWGHVALLQSGWWWWWWWGDIMKFSSPSILLDVLIYSFVPPRLNIIIPTSSPACVYIC